MKNYFIVFGALVYLIAFPFAGVYAATYTTDDFFVLSENETIDDNVYVFAESVDISGIIKGDLIAAAGTLRIVGVIEGDVIAVGGDVTIGGEVRGDIRVFAGNLQIDSVVNGNVLGASGELDVTDDASVGHSLTVAAGVLKMNGSIAKNVIATGGLMTINGTVGNDVLVRTDRDGSVVLGSESRIGGDVRYVSLNDLQRLSGAEVAGIIQKVDIAPSPKKGGVIVTGYLLYKIFSLLMLIVVGTLFIKVFPNVAKEFAKEFEKQPGMTLLYGFSIFFLVPVVFIILLITLIGIPLALILIALYFILLYVSNVAAALTVGALIMKRVGKINDARLFLSFIIGAVVIALFTVLPFFDFVFSMILVWWGVGLLFVVIHARYKG